MKDTRKPFLFFITGATCAVLTACAAHYPVYGRFDRSNELLRGAVRSETITGMGTIELKGARTGTRCAGRSQVRVGAPGETGRVTLDCGDGRVVEARYIVTGWGKGHGSGQDQNRIRFYFTFGMSEQEALPVLKEPAGR